MTKAECEYCCDEDDCTSTEHTIDCIFCPCQDKYPTNFTCDYCNHDMAWCDCPEEEQKKRFDELIDNLKAMSKEFEKQWNESLKSETE